MDDERSGGAFGAGGNLANQVAAHGLHRVPEIPGGGVVRTDR
jgi:hypothetical protein